MDQTMSTSELQFAFFFSNPPINLKYDEFSVDFRRMSVFQGKGLDLQTFIFPVPNDVPQDFPRCQITSNDKLHLQITGARCDIKFNIQNESEKILFNQILQSMIELFKKFNISIIRVGYIRRYIIKSDNPDNVIKNNFLKITDDSLFEPFVRFVFKHQVSDVLYNDIYQIETAQQQNFSTGAIENIILLTQDFNTLPESLEIIDENTLSTFLSNIPDQKVTSYIELLNNNSK